MTEEQLRAMAKFMIKSYGAQAFVTAVERAQALTQAGHTDISLEWRQIAELVSEIEMVKALEKPEDRAPAP